MKKLIKKFEDIIDEEFNFSLQYPSTHDATLCAEECKKVAIEFAKYCGTHNKKITLDGIVWLEESGHPTIEFSTEQMFNRFIEGYYGE